MESFKEGEWVVLRQMNNRRLARISRKGYTLLGRDSVSLEGVIGCLPWTNFKMTPQIGSKGGKRCFNLEPMEENELVADDDEEKDGEIQEIKDNRTINDDGQSQSLSSTEIEALRDEGLSGKEIVNQIIAGSATFDKKTRYSQKKYLRKKESKHCLRERVGVRRTTLSNVAEILCSGGSGEGGRGSIIGMRPDTLSQMLTALNIQWYCSAKSVNFDETRSADSQGTMYIVYESSSWGLLVASLLNYLPARNCRVLHLYPGHGIPTLIAPKALNLPDDKFSILSSVNLKALLQKLGKLGNLDVFSQIDDKNESKLEYCPGENADLSSLHNVCENKFQEIIDTNHDDDHSTESNDRDISISGKNCEADVDSCVDQIKCEKDKDSSVPLKSEDSNHTVRITKRKVESIGDFDDLGNVAKKPRWEQEAEKAADLLNTRKADGLVVVASKEHPVSLVLALLPYLAPSRPLVVYCPYREPLLELYAVLKGMEPWVGRCKVFGSRETLSKMVNLRLTESWLRNYQVLPDRTHPEINMSPGGGYVLSGTLVDHNDS